MSQKIVGKITVIFILLELIIMFHITYIDYIETQIGSSNYLTSNEATTIVFNGDYRPSSDELNKIIGNLDVNIVAITYETADLVVCVYWGEEFFNKIKNISDENKNIDFTDENIAFVGKNILLSEYCYRNEKNEIKFKYEEDVYVTIEINEKYYSSMLNNVVFICSNKYDNFQLDEIIVDSNSSDDIKLTVDNIMQNFKSYTVDEDNRFIEDYIYGGYEETFNFLVILLEVILIITIVMIIIVHLSNEVKIKNIIGIPISKIIFDIETIILSNFLFSMGFVFMIYMVLFWAIFGTSHNFISIIRIYFTVYIVIVLFICLYYFIASKIYLKNGLK